MTASIFFSAFRLLPASASVTINGKALPEIQDVIQVATGSEYQELPKHSLLLYEQRSNGSGISAARSTVFMIGTDGARLKQHTLQDTGLYSTPLSGRGNVVQRMNLSVSAKRFGMNRNLMHTIAGHSYLGTDYLSVYGGDRIHTDSFDLNATIISYADNQRTPNRCNIWGNALMTIKGMEDRDVFVYAVTDIMAMSGSLRVGFIAASRSETSGGSGGAHVDIVNQDSNNEFELFNYDNGIHGVCIGAGDMDSDGYKNEFAVGFHDDGYARVYIYSVTSSGSRLTVTRLHSQLLHEGGQANSIMGYRQTCPKYYRRRF